MQLFPKKIEIIGNQLGILWSNGHEDFFPHDFLRMFSPSAENLGETDIFGNVYGGSEQNNFKDVSIHGWDSIGNYAIKINFSDNHSSGLFSWKYLQKLASHLNSINTHKD